MVGVDHPYFSSAFTFADGVTVHNRSRRPRDKPDATRSEEERLIAIRQAEAIVQAQDLVFVLDELARISHRSSRAIFAARLDLAKVGMFGHSRGGFAAPHACLLDARFKACVNLDGYRLTEAVMRQGIRQPYMHIQEIAPWLPPPTDQELREAGQTRAEADGEAIEAEREWNATFGRMTGGAWVVTMAGAAHMSFSDAPYIARDKYPQIAIAPARALAIANAYLLGFFDRQLRAGPGALLAGPAPFPEVEVRAFAGTR